MGCGGMEIGNLRVDPVLDGSFRMRPTDLYAGTTEQAWQPHRDLLDQDGRLEVATGGCRVRGNSRVVPVGLGAGPAATDSAARKDGRFLQSLEQLGVKPDDVTDVV